MLYIFVVCFFVCNHNFETTQSIVDRGNFSSFQGVQGNDYVCQRPIFGHFTMSLSPPMHEINKFEEWFVFSQNLKVYMFLLCDLYNFFLHLQLQKLEFEEFLELLGMSVQMSLDSIDAKLIPFLNMNFLWYSGLFKKLQAKYPDTHRCFTSSDGLVQYIVSWCY